ncbi:MAG: energy-coupling factor transporter transmembrane component T, partial [Oscillospiraceae bacterium]
IKRINNSQKTMGLYSSNGYIKKFKSGSRVLSAIVSWSLENSIDTASSMKARGYGLKNRTNYSNFNFILKDKLILFFVIFFSVIIFFGAANGEMDFYYYPQISSINITPFSLLCYLSYFIIAFSPLILEFTECLKWKYCKSKI